jgi:hypothetical protein
MAPTTPDWDYLSVLDDKRAHYAEDSYFRQGWQDVARAWPENPAWQVQRFATMLIRPEAIYTRRAQACLDAAVAHGFRLAAFAPMVLSRHIAFDLWRFQHNAGTLDRLAVTELVFDARPAIFLLLADTSSSVLPAAARLSSVKGANNPTELVDGTIRAAAGSAQRLLPMVHTADEPADVVRELGLLFSGRDRRALLPALASGVDRYPQFEASCRGWLEGWPKRSLDPLAALARVEAALPSGAGQLGRLRAAAAGEGPLDFADLLSGIEPGTVDDWDLVLVGAEFVRCDDSDEMLVRGDGRSGWLAGQGRRAPEADERGRLPMAPAAGKITSNTP